jgi:hypothetical protein
VRAILIVYLASHGMTATMESDPLDRRQCLAKLEQMTRTVRESGLEHKVIVATCERGRRR